MAAEAHPGPLETTGCLSPAPGTGLDAQSERMHALLQVARDLQTAIGVDDLLDLLPDGPVRSTEDLREWLNANPGVGTVRDDRVRPVGLPEGGSEMARRHALAEERWREACKELPRLLGPAMGLVRTVVVTGSVAYGECGSEDDLDLFVITRQSGLWPFLLLAFLAFRLRSRLPRGKGVWCLNHAIDEQAVLRYLSSSRGVLEARELLVARPILGGAFYQEVLASTPWLHEELPRLCARRGLPPRSGAPDPRPAPIVLRAVNALLFPIVAAYLQITGTRSSGRSRREGRDLETFRTVTTLERLSLLSRKFDHLRSLYASPRSGRARGAEGG